MTTIRVLMLIAALGHALCFFCDCMLSYTPDRRRLQLNCLNDSDKLAEQFEGMSLSYPMRSMLLGIPAMAMISCGYFGLYTWMRQFSLVCAAILIVSTGVFLVSGTAHHVFCGVIEWLYIRLGRTTEAHGAIIDFHKKTVVTMYACYASLAAFMVTLFVRVLSGGTSLPGWACIFNAAPLLLILLPTKLPGKGNIAGAIMFLGLFFVV